MSFILAITAAAAVIPADGHQPALALAGVGVYLARAGGARRASAVATRRRAKVAGMAGAGPMVADLRAESDELDALVAELSAERVGRANTPAPGWTIAHQIAHLLWTDRVALHCRHRRGRIRGGTGGGGQGPRRFRRRGCRGARRHPARSTAGRLAPDPRPTARRAHGGRRRPQAAVVRSADERRVDGHRPVDGDVGARPRRRRRARRATARDRAAALDRAHRGAHPDYAFAVNGLTPPPDPFRVELRRRTGPRVARDSTWVVGSRGCRAASHRFGRGLLHAGHAAPAALGSGRAAAGRTPNGG